MTTPTVLFWASLALLTYAYFGYPVLLVILTHRRSSKDSGRTHRPTVSVIVAAYNEEACIARKLRNVLDHDYPADCLEMVVVSDGSTDRTDAIVTACADARVRFARQPARSGKNAALNRGAEIARGDILVSTDANAMLTPGALRHLVAPFTDPAVGLVSGQGLYGELGDGTTRVVSNAYVRYEAFIKQREAALGFVAAADGALYALRRELYTPLPSNQVHDLVHPIQMTLAGRRSAFVPDAFTVEPPSASAGNELQRHVRIIAQGLRVFLRQAPALLVHGHLSELWMLVSHRMLRWAGSLLLAIAVVTNVFLLGAHPVYAVTLAGQAAFYGLAGAGAIAERVHVRMRFLAIPYFFCVVNLAGAMALLQFVGGHAHSVWRTAGERR